MSKSVVCLTSAFVFLSCVVARPAGQRRAREAMPEGDWVQVTPHAEFSPRDTSSGTIHGGNMWLSNGYYHGCLLYTSDAADE